MAICKKTGLDMIAKRIPRTDIFAGVLGEHRGAWHRVGAPTWSDFTVPNTTGQLTVTIGRNGKLRRNVWHRGDGSLVTNWASGTSTRKR